MNPLVLETTKLSLLVQILTSLYGVVALIQPIPPELDALKVALGIEMFVQTLELLFYVWFVRNFNLATMAQTRYKDWIFSTPLMLISSMLYFYFEELRTLGLKTDRAVSEFFEKHSDTVRIVVVANFLMLAFGYAGEVGVVSRNTGVVLGFVAFAVTFYTIWERLASKSDSGKRVFTFTCTVWALYGVAFMLPVAQMNIAYNALDVVAKNFFGLFLAYKVRSLAADKS